jgi:hypothetical protein
MSEKVPTLEELPALIQREKKHHDPLEVFCRVSLPESSASEGKPNPTQELVDK